MSYVNTFCLCLVMAWGVILQAAGADGPCRIYLKDSVQCGIFTTRNGQWSLAQRSDIRLSYTKEGIVLEAELRAPAGKKFLARGKKNDDLGLFSGSVFEFQLAPPSQNGVYYHFGLSPSSWMYSAKKKDIKWNGKGVKYTTKCVPEKYWRFSLKVPWSSIGEKMPRKGDVWRMHMGKSVPTRFAPAEHSSISGAVDYHKIEQYAFLIFGKDAPPEQSLLLSHIELRGKNFDFYFVSKGKTSPGTLYFSANGATYGGRVPLVQSKDGEFWKGSIVPVAPGGYFPLKNNIDLALCVKNNVSRILCRGKALLSANEMAKVLLNKFYYTKEDPVIRYEHTLPGKTSVVIKRGNRAVYTLLDAPAKGQLSLRELKLAPGRYTLEINDGTHAVEQLFFVLAKTPRLRPMKAQTPLKIRKDLTFSMGGEALYLLGLSRAKVAIPYKSVFNFYYNPAGARQNSVTMPNMPGGKLVRRPFLGRIYGDESAYLKRIADYAAKLSDSKKAVFHLLSYEAQIRAVVRDSKGRIVPGSTADLMKRAYRIAKSIAPDSLFSIHVDNEKQIPYYAASCDVFQSAFWRSSYGADMIPELAGSLDELRSLVPGKPLIMWLGGTIPHHRNRIAEEIRCGVYLSIVKGMAGNIIHMGHEPMPLSRTRMWSLLAGLPVEIEGFYPDFISGKDVEFTQGNKHIVTRMRVLPNGEKILIAVNTHAVQEILTLPASLAKTVRIHGAGRDANLSVHKEKDPSFWSFLTGQKELYKDILTGYEPKVYYLKD